MRSNTSPPEAEVRETVLAAVGEDAIKMGHTPSNWIPPVSIDGGRTFFNLASILTRKNASFAGYADSSLTLSPHNKNAIRRRAGAQRAHWRI